ncbi:HK97 family phage prohead protease [Roseovarius sp. C03]|uniref:HK97 family phage prohead protease n=1 Tax=Roseovarius sp. C03 TaxID=3449222 RepID=UPI003EDC00C6
MSKTNDTGPGATREVRSAAVPIEIRDEDGAAIGVTGYAAVFNERANILDIFEEEIAPGAFDAALERGDDTVFLINHEGLPLARTSSGTLRLSTDARGLKIDTDLDAGDPDVGRILPKMKRGDLSKMSFAFRAKREEWDDTGDLPVRRILEVELFDVSIVTDPAYAGTEIGLRSMRAALGDIAALKGADIAQRMKRKARLAGIAV